MNVFNPWVLLALAGSWPAMAGARLEVLPDPEPQRVFAGEPQTIAIRWHNPGSQTATGEVHVRVLQTSSATATSLAEKFWKQIEILPGQTVLDSASLDFPAVNAETRFLVQWLEGTNLVIGRTQVLVYPTNLLAELKVLAGEDNLGVLDPNNDLQPLFRQNKIGFLDLGETVLEDFQGKLAIIGPFSTRAQMSEDLAPAIGKMARKGVAVVWLQPPPGPKDRLAPSFYVVPEGKGSVVVVQADTVARPSGNPQSQLNLVYLCKLALNPTPFALPDLRIQP